MLRVVLDTNIYISAFLSSGSPWFIFRLAEYSLIDVYVTESILAEVKRVLSYPRIGFSEGAIRAILERIRDSTNVVSPSGKKIRFKSDPGDVIILACAHSCDAHYIVSGDSHLLDVGEWKGILIRTPTAFLRETGWIFPYR